MTQKAQDDNTLVGNYEDLLSQFNEICNLPVTDKTKKTILEIKEKASHSKLTMRQSDAIQGRCTHYLAGTYGKDKIKDAYIKENKSS